jgi:NTP pyrophosphatase (non-canonical NTP hydrolase)
MPRETSASIAAWADETFGPAKDLSVLIDRAQQEFAELTAAVAAGENNDIAAEAADIVILLHRLAHLSGADLTAAVDAKMSINRSRQWVRAGNGVGRHIKPVTE